MIEDGGEQGDYLDPTMTTGTERRGSAVAHDAVFGEITEDGPNYRAVRLITNHLSLTRLMSSRLAGKVPSFSCSRPKSVSESYLSRQSLILSV